MTIAKALSENMGRTVKLGFGSGFVYCDTITKETFDVVSEISDYYKDFFKKNLKVAKSKMRYLLEKGEQAYINELMAREVREAELYGLKKPLHDENYYSTEYFKKIGSLAKLIADIQESIDKFVHFLDAPVSDKYESCDENAIIIVSKKNPRVVGKYWTSEEYKRGEVNDECI